MARQQRELTPGYTVVYPNRGKASSKLARIVVVLFLLASIALMLVVTIGGWSKLQGMKPVNFGWCLVYLIVALYVTRWTRGLLPIAAAMAIVLMILSLIAATGYAGTSWFDRSSTGFGHASTLFGGQGLSSDLIGTITWIIVPVQALLIVFSMIAFGQGWNVEQEVKMEEAQRRRGGGSKPKPVAPVTA